MQKLGWFGGLGVTQGHRKHSHSIEHCHVCLVFAVDWAMRLRDWICIGRVYLTRQTAV